MVAELEFLGSVPLAILGVALLLLAAWGAGGALLSVVKMRQDRKLDLALLRMALGLNLVALAGVLLGQWGWLAVGRSLWLLLGLSLLPVARSRIWRDGSTAGALRRNWAAFDRNRYPRSLILVVLAAGLTLGPALAFPAGWDELVYHGVVPRRWHADGWPAVYFDLPYSAFPSLCEILFWLMASLDCVIAPRLLSWVCWALGLLILARLVSRPARGAAGVVMTCAFMLGPATLMISANCYVESMQMLNVAAILLAFEIKSGAGDDIHRGSPILLGVLAGGTAAVKLTGLTVLLLPCLWFVGEVVRDRSRFRPAMWRMWISSTVAVGVCLPFYWRAWAATGNPFYPYFDEWFSSDLARLEMSRFHHDIGGLYFGVRSVESFFAGPILMVLHERLYDGSFGWQSWLMLVLSAVALVSCVRRRVSRLAMWPAVVSAMLYISWFLTAQQARFAVPLVLAGVLVAGFGFRLLRRPLRCWAIGALLATTLASLPWKTAGYYFGSWETVLGFWTWTEYVDDGTDQHYVPLVRAIGKQTPEEAKLLLLIEHRGLYLPRTNIIGTPFFQAAIFTPPEKFTTPGSVLEVLDGHQITHLVIAKSSVGPDRVPVWWERMAPLFRAIDECERLGRLRVVWESETHVLLAVQSTR